MAGLTADNREELDRFMASVNSGRVDPNPGYENHSHAGKVYRLALSIAECVDMLTVGDDGHERLGWLLDFIDLAHRDRYAAKSLLLSNGGTIPGAANQGGGW